MPDFNLVILYVNDIDASVLFYRQLLGRDAVEPSPSFAMFTMPSGAGLALWSRQAAEPTPQIGGGGAEIVFMDADVDGTYAEWLTRGLMIAQSPVDLDFGRSFVALDPNGHRIRVFAPA